MQVPSVFKPTIRAVDSVENFDKIWTDITPHDSPCSTPRCGSAAAQELFRGFSYVAPPCFSHAGAPVVSGFNVPG